MQLGPKMDQSADLNDEKLLGAARNLIAGVTNHIDINARIELWNGEHIHLGSKFTAPLATRIASPGVINLSCVAPRSTGSSNTTYKVRLISWAERFSISKRQPQAMLRAGPSKRLNCSKSCSCLRYSCSAKQTSRNMHEPLPAAPKSNPTDRREQRFYSVPLRRRQRVLRPLT